jgi:serine/threonine-protein kinase
VKVLDFGLAKAFEGEGGRPDLTASPTLSLAATQQGVILGTAAYMSPEQASGAPTDRRADIWSFGVVFFEMLTGRQLFSGKTVSHVLADLLRSEPDWKALPPNLHSRLRLLLERCLEKEPRDRQHDIADVRVDLERVLAAPGGVLEKPIAQREAPAAARRMWPLAVAAVLAALAAGVAGWLLKPAAPAEVVRFQSELPGTSDFRLLNFPVVALTADGRRVVQNTSAGLYLLSVDQLEGRLISGTERTIANVMFSPDGEWFGYLDGQTTQLVKLPVGGGGSVPLTSVDGNTFTGASWTDDDWILFANDRTVRRVSANGGTPEVLFEVPAGQASLPQLLPDGRTVLFTLGAAGAEPQTVIWPIGADEPEASFPGSWARYLRSGHLVYAVGGSLFARRFDLSSRALVGGPVPVVEGVATGAGPQFDVSVSGALVYLPTGTGGAENRGLAVVTPDGRRDRLEGIPLGPYSSPRVSPDGTRVVLQTTEDVPLTTSTARLWVYDLSGDTALRPLTQSGKNFHPIWTPDSRRITFASDRDGQAGIYWQAADGSGVPERLTTADEGTEHWPDSWSPDGRTLAYQVVTGGDYDIWTLSLDSPDAPKPFADGPARQHGAAFSPDGRWLAYGATEGSRQEQIYVRPFPPTGETYQITRESGAFAVWSPDGSALSYRRMATGTSGEAAPALMQVEIVAGDRFAWRNEQQLPFKEFLVFGGLRDYDVLPDGERFVMLFPPDQNAEGDAERPRITIVLNWVEELKARVGAD